MECGNRGSLDNYGRSNDLRLGSALGDKSKTSLCGEFGSEYGGQWKHGHGPALRSQTSCSDVIWL